LNTLGDAGMFFAKCGKGGDFLVPLTHAYPFLMMMGKVISGWLLIWEAGVAADKLDALCKEQGVDASGQKGRADLINKNKEAAFYAGKVTGAKFFIRNVLPEVESALKAIKSGDLSPMEITDDGFCS